MCDLHLSSKPLFFFRNYTTHADVFFLLRVRSTAPSLIRSLALGCLVEVSIGSNIFFLENDAMHAEPRKRTHTGEATRAHGISSSRTIPTSANLTPDNAN